MYVWRLAAAAEGVGNGAALALARAPASPALVRPHRPAACTALLWGWGGEVTMGVGMEHCRLVSPPSAARLCPRAQEEPAMIHALFTMSLAMPLEKMAKGDESQHPAHGAATYYDGPHDGALATKLYAPPFYKLDMAEEGCNWEPACGGVTMELGGGSVANPNTYTLRGGSILEPSQNGEKSWIKSTDELKSTTQETPAAVAVHGDPMFQHDGKGQHFWIKEGVLTALLNWESDDGHKMSLQGLTVANAETGHQWFKQIALTSDGKKVLSSQAVFDDKPTLALSSLNTSTVTIDSFVKGNGVDAKDVTGVSAGGMTFELTAESAHKFVDTVQQQKYAHINVKMPHGITDGATGLFAEFAGAQPMSDATKALLRSPN